jgi:serine/threonine protein kinase
MSKENLKFYQVKDNISVYNFKANGSFSKVKDIAEGSFGKVILVQKNNKSNYRDSKYFAIKINKRFRLLSKKKNLNNLQENKIEEETDKPKELNFIEIREMALMKTFKHENVLNLIEIHFDKPNRETWMLMDYIPTDLAEFFKENAKNPKVMNETFFKNISKQILSGVNYLHENMVIHRDLKLENILYDSDHNVVKIGDFGLSRKFDYEINNEYTNVGTPAYQPPELILGSAHYSSSFDIWSVGCILVAICTGKILFGAQNSLLGDNNSKAEDNNSLGILKLIIKIFGTLNDKNLPGFKTYPNSGILKNLTETKGFGLIKYIEDNQLFHFENGNFYDLIEKMLCIDPLKRISAKECLEHPWFNVSNI